MGQNTCHAYKEKYDMNCCTKCPDSIEKVYDQYNLNVVSVSDSLCGFNSKREKFQNLKIPTNKMKDKYDKLYRIAGYPFYTVQISKFMNNLNLLETSYPTIN